jgi:hypothetical protein
MAVTPTYLGAVSTAIGQGLLTGAWIASGGMSRGRRRAVRLAATAAVMAAGVIAERRDDRAVTWTPEDGLTVEPGDGPRRPGAAVSAAGVVFGLGMIVGRRQMEKRWLAQLQRDGHEHPHRALALRMGLLAVAATLPGKLMKARAARDTSR